MKQDESTPTRLKNTTRERIKSHGNMGESFDKVINRILDFYEEHKGE